jgi:hypothetical protein
VARGRSNEGCGGACELTAAAPESSPEQSGREAVVRGFQRGGGQSEEELEGKLTNVVAELGRATRWGHGGGRLSCSKATDGGDPWMSLGRGKRAKQNPCSLPVLTNPKGEGDGDAVIRHNADGGRSLARWRGKVVVG